MNTNDNEQKEKSTESPNASSTYKDLTEALEKDNACIVKQLNLLVTATQGHCKYIEELCESLICQRKCSRSENKLRFDVFLNAFWAPIKKDIMSFTTITVPVFTLLYFIDGFKESFENNLFLIGFLLGVACAVICKLTWCAIYSEFRAHHQNKAIYCTNIIFIVWIACYLLIGYLSTTPIIAAIIALFSSILSMILRRHNTN